MNDGECGHICSSSTGHVIARRQQRCCMLPMNVRLPERRDLADGEKVEREKSNLSDTFLDRGGVP
jgi:hypothetical protein